MEGKSFLSPTEKRSGEPDPIRRFGSTNRGMTLSALAQPNSPLPVPAGHVVFRILCPGYRVGAVIGKSGSVITQIRKSTKSNIRVVEAPLGSPDGIIRVIAEAGSTSRVKLGVSYASYEEEEVEVSKAQDALIRVFEAIHDGFRSGTVSCRLIMEASHVGAVKGKGDEMVERIRMETGCQISIGTDDLPICADPDDAVVEIKGNFLAVKKALVSLSRRLQACQQICKTRMVRNKSLDRDLQEILPVDNYIQEALPRCSNVIPHNARHRETEVFPRGALHRYTEAVPREASYGSSDVFQGDLSQQYREIYLRDSLDRHTEIGQNDALDRPLESFSRDAYQRRVDATTQEILSRKDFPSRRGSALDTHPHSITASGSKNHHATIKQPLSESEFGGRKMVLKILCPTESAGGVIGPGGTNIKTLQSETGASIDVGDTPDNCEEFLITITSEVPDGRQSPAQRAIVLVFSRIYETFTNSIVDSGSRSFIMARLVVPTNRIRSLLDSSPMWIAIGAFIVVLDVWENPKCISADDRIVQIIGQFPNVKEAIFHVTRLLRCGPPRNGTYIPGRICLGKTNPGSMGFHPSSTMSTSLPRRSEDSFRRRSQNPVNYSKPVDVDPYIRPEDPFPNRFSPTDGHYPNFGQRATMDVNDILTAAPSQLGASPPPAAPRGAYDGSGGLSSTRADPGLGSGHKSSIVTGVTVEIRVSEIPENFLCGEEDGHNRLQDLRQISGARVIVHELHQGTRDRIITISGTPVYQTKPK